MNIDCIEHVLELLNFKDLLNVAKSNKLLHFVACRVIAHRYATKRLTLILDGMPFCWPTSMESMRLDNGLLYALKFRTSLDILQYFGCVCPEITIHYKYMSSRERRTIEYYLSKYCSDESALLKRLTLDDCPKNALDSIKRPLKSVQKVTITGDSLLNFDSLTKCIPNMMSMKLTWLQLPNRMGIERNFPLLEKFHVEVNDRMRGFTPFNVQQAIRKNPQIKQLYVQVNNTYALNSMEKFLETYRIKMDMDIKLIQGATVVKEAEEEEEDDDIIIID